MSEIVLVDTNVLLDVLLAREPFVSDSQKIWAMIESKAIRGVVSAASVLNVYYIVHRLASRRAADGAIRGIRDIFEIAPVDREVIQWASDARGADFEDSVQLACAIGAKAACIITRDAKHFAGAQIPVIPPDVYLARVGG